MRVTNGGKRTVRNRIRTILWGFKIAWQIDRKMLLFWSAITVGLSVLPAFALRYNREVISRITSFIADGSGSYPEVVPSIAALGVILTLIGLSTRVNSELLYMMMYDSYYLGMEELLMDSIQKVEMTDLLKTEVNDEYLFIVNRAGSLTDLMSGFCSIVGKAVSITSLLVVAYSSARAVFVISLIYVIGVFILNFSFTERVRRDAELGWTDERMVAYFERMPESPGTAKEIRVYENTEQVASGSGHTATSQPSNEPGSSRLS